MSAPTKSATGLSRRFLNLIVDNRINGIKSLCSMDVEHLFGFPATIPQTQDATTQAPFAENAGYKKNEAAATLTMESIQIPPPHFSVEASATSLGEQRKIDCFPLADSTVICADHLGRAFLLDAYWGAAGALPRLHKPKRMPISIFIPKPDAERSYDTNGCGRSLFVMERIPEPEAGCSPKDSDQFEAFVSSRRAITSYCEIWKCKLLPPPPYVREPNYSHGCPEISSYAVLDGGSQICISVHDVGTYCLDTENLTWSEVGRWTLPFRGKVEYVPELNLWLGFSAKDRHLAATDLSSISTMKSQPQLMDLGKELDTPDEWKEHKDSQLVNLGSGRFCIARFFHARTFSDNFWDDSIVQEFAVFTGVEVVPRILNPNGCANSSGSFGELRMTPHKSRCHTSNNGIAIAAVF